MAKFDKHLFAKQLHDLIVKLPNDNINSTGELTYNEEKDEFTIEMFGEAIYIPSKGGRPMGAFNPSNQVSFDLTFRIDMKRLYEDEDA